MKRYYIVNEFFGSRIYDSVQKKEMYFDKINTVKIKKLLEGNYNEINSCNDINGKNLISPIKISMNITKKCNLRCKQCFSNSGEVNEQELTTKNICKLFDEMNKHGTFFICIGGGEPLMREDLMDILDYGKSKQLAISIVSNGLLLDKKLIERLNYMELDTFWISLDGLEFNHDYLRGKGSFKKAIESIQLLSKYCKCKKAIRVSLNRNNIHEVKDLIKIAEENSFDIIRFTPLIEFGRAKNENLTISQIQYIEFMNQIKKIQSKVEIIYPNMAHQKYWINSDDFGCHCGKEAVWIDELGNYSPCIFFGENYNVGNIKNDDYIDLWDKSTKIVEFCGNKICKTCENYYQCRGGCRARTFINTGNFNDIDPLCPLGKNIKYSGDFKNEY